MVLLLASDNLVQDISTAPLLHGINSFIFYALVYQLTHREAKQPSPATTHTRPDQNTKAIKKCDVLLPRA